MKKYQVQAVHCYHLASDEDVYTALKRATAPLTRSWQRLKAARCIAIKFNQDWPSEPRLFAGQRREHVSDSVARATLRLLRENTNAKLIAVDASFFTAYTNAQPGATTWLKHVFREYDVEYVDGHQPPIDTCDIPGGGVMFNRYFLSRRLLEADAVVSVQKMKNHRFMGITLCLKNLFGLLPTEPLGRPRSYYHHLVRMPYMLVDIGRILDPALNILDALISQAGQEWGGEEARLTNTLIAGDNIIATDTCGAHLMGHDPQSDWLTAPFHRDRNALRVAAEIGFGTDRLDEIDFQSEVQAPLGNFFTLSTDAQSTVVNWRRTTAEQALYYRDHQRELINQFGGEYIMLQQGVVRWHNPSGRIEMSRRLIAGDLPEQALWFKYVDPDELEGEHFEVYEQTLAQIKAMGL